MTNGTILGIAGAFMLVSAAASVAYTFGTSDTATFTVTDKERIVESSVDSEGNSRVSSKYLIFADGEVLENTDSLLKWKFNSSDIYGQLREDGTYRCDVYGWRIPMLSSYRNIVSCEELKAPAP